MPEFLFLDGPLAGQLLVSTDPHVEGELLEVEVVDAVQLEVPRHPYLVSALPSHDRPGGLRHAGPSGQHDRADPDDGLPVAV